jgi:hypothetical protein
MNNRAKLIAALSASATAGFVLAAVLLPDKVPASPAPTNLSQRADAASICSSPAREIAPFYSEMSVVNMRMHEDMTANPSGDVDRDFIQMMVPHHQGAIDMARALLKYGRDERLKRLAQSIVVEQAQEIAYMRALRDAPAASSTDHNTRP